MQLRTCDRQCLVPACPDGLALAYPRILFCVGANQLSGTVASSTRQPCTHCSDSTLQHNTAPLTANSEYK